MNGACGTSLPSTSHAEIEVRGRRVARVAALCGVAFAVGLSSASVAVAAATTTSPRPQPQHLWRAYPLDSAKHGSPTTQSPHPRTRSSPASDEGTSGGETTNILMGLGAALLLAGSVAGFALYRMRADVSVRSSGAGSIHAPWLLSRPHEGGSTMANRRRRKWARREPEMFASGGEEASAEAVQQADNPEAAEEPAPQQAESELPADLSDVGAEVGAVLASAREAAARIRSQANEDSTKLREEAKAAAEDELAEARQLAAEDRGEGARIRAEADAYANETRADAETFAEQTRTGAERESAKIVEEARGRLEAADAEVAQKIRDLTASARERLNMLQAGSRRHEERLEHMLVVFRGMTSQLEELLGEREAEDGGENLEEALQPDSAASRFR
jgi:F0F1-type ATP synthase membrane subunit b/b'